MKKTIGQIVGRIKFTENEISMARGLADAVYDINLEFSEKENIKLSKEQKNEMKEKFFKLVSKIVWEYKVKFYQNKEIPEDKFKDFAMVVLKELFID